MPRKGGVDDTLQLSKVIGLTTFHGSSITSCSNIDGVFYAAGCVAVHYSSKENAQIGFYSATKAISSLAISPDGRFLALGERGHQPSIIIWNLLKQEKVAVLTEHKFGIGCLSFSPNGRYLVSVGFKPDKQLILWDWESGRKLSVQRIGNKVFSINFHKDGHYFVTAGDRHLKWWYITEVLDGEAVGLEGKPASIAEAQRTSIFVDVICGYGSTEGVTFCTTAQGVLCTFNQERAVEKWVQLESPVSYTMELFSSTGAAGLLLVGCANGVIRAFLPSTLEYITTLPRPVALDSNHIAADELDNSLNNIETLDGEDGKYAACWALRQVHGSVSEPIPKLCAIYADRSLIVWDVSDLFAVKLFRSFLAHRSCVWDVQFVERFSLSNSFMRHEFNLSSSSLPQQGTFVTCSADNSVRFWNLQSDGALGASSRKITTTNKSPGNDVRSDYFSHFSEEMVSCIEFRNEDEPHAHANQQQSASIMEDTLTLSTATGISLLHGGGAAGAGGGKSGQPVEFDYSKGIPDLEIPDRPQSSFSPRTVAIHPFGHQIICGDKTGKLRIYDLKTMQLVHSVQAHSAEILTLSFSPPLVTYDQGRTWVVYTGDEEETEDSSPIHKDDLLVLLATAGRDRLIHVFNANHPQYTPIDTLDHHSSSVTTARFTSDGKRLISCGGDKTIVFHAVNGPSISKLKTVQTPMGTINGLSVEVSNKFAVTSGQDKRIHIWNVSDGKLMRAYKSLGQMNSELYKNDLDPSGSFIVTCSFDKQITLVDFFSGEVLCQLGAHSELVTGLKFSPDGSSLVSVGGDGLVMVWKTSYSLMRSMKDRLIELFSKAQKRNTKALTKQSLSSSAASSSVFPPPPPTLPTNEASNVQSSLSNLKMKIHSNKNLLQPPSPSPPLAQDPNAQTNISALTADTLASHQQHQQKKNRWQENLSKEKGAYEIFGKKVVAAAPIDESVESLASVAHRNKFTLELTTSPLDEKTMRPPLSAAGVDQDLPLPIPPAQHQQDEPQNTNSHGSAANGLESTSHLAATREAEDGVNLPEISSDEEEDDEAEAQRLFKSLDEYESDFDVSPSPTKRDSSNPNNPSTTSTSSSGGRKDQDEDNELSKTQDNLDKLEKSAQDLESWLEEMLRNDSKLDESVSMGKPQPSANPNPNTGSSQARDEDRDPLSQSLSSAFFRGIRQSSEKKDGQTTAAPVVAAPAQAQEQTNEKKLRESAAAMAQMKERLRALEASSTFSRPHEDQDFTLRPPSPPLDPKKSKERGLPNTFSATSSSSQQQSILAKTREFKQILRDFDLAKERAMRSFEELSQLRASAGLSLSAGLSTVSPAASMHLPPSSSSASRESADQVNLRESLAESQELLAAFQASLSSLVSHPALSATLPQPPAPGGFTQTMKTSTITASVAGQSQEIDVAPLLEKYSDRLLDLLLQKMQQR